MSEVVADTHAILWYIFQTSRLSAVARAAMIAAESTAIHVSAITLVEIAYLIDKGRFAEAILDQLIQAMDDPASGITLAPITIGVSRAVRIVPRKLVPDMPDRIIAATAVHLGLPLVTADSQIHSSGIAIIW
jgi:PIN domain nuclease of toxin-antitoxin system